MSVKCQEWTPRRCSNGGLLADAVTAKTVGRCYDAFGTEPLEEIEDNLWSVEDYIGILVRSDHSWVHPVVDYLRLVFAVRRISFEPYQA